MDLAYDHITEETIRSPTPRPSAIPNQTNTGSEAPPSPRSTLPAELQETFRAFSSSPWAAKLGGFFGNVRKQGESYYEGARREVEEVSEDAFKGFTNIKESFVNRTRSLSPGGDEKTPTGVVVDEKVRGPELLTEEKTLQENDSLIARFKSEAAKRLKEIEKAEDAADEALLRFGTNIRNFLRDAVAVAPPGDDDMIENQKSEVLFESKDTSGKRVIHATRLDAQLHVIHTRPESFTTDPESDKWGEFRDGLEVGKRTEQIAKDLDDYLELRRAMEGLVPEQVEYKDFWCRYYFLRMVLEAEESRRKEMLRGASTQAANEDEVGWDEDSDDEQTTSTPQGEKAEPSVSHQANDSTTTLQPVAAAESDTLKPATGRRSHDRQSQPDSDASYDLVSGATSRAPGSPKDDRPKEKKSNESDEEDWE